MKTQTCCFTGHRNIPVSECAAIQKRLDSEIRSLINQGFCDFIAGGALGFDTMAALSVLSLKAEFPKTRLILALPCRDQAKHWGKEDKKIYDQIHEKADEVVYSSDAYYPGCMWKRNRYMADRSAFCVCWLTEAKGGTAYTVRYATQKGVPVVNLAMR